MDLVLVLNASYEPLGLVDVERAVTLVVLDRAETVLGTGKLLRSSYTEIEEPSVIRLTRMVKPRRGHKVPLSRKALFARDNYECAFCGKPADTIDHVTPKAQGGKHEWQNVVACCGPCNHYKRDRTPEEAGMTLRFLPFVPTRAYMLGSRGRPEWSQFLTPFDKAG